MLKKCLLVLLFFAFLGKVNATPPPSEGYAIDMVICVDLSASTNGVLQILRDRMWDIVSEFGKFRPFPDFRLGVIAYGRPSFEKKNNYINIISDLSHDLDNIAIQLYDLRPQVSRGNIYVGEVMDVAFRTMSWSTDADAFKMIFLIGNGPIDNGMIHPVEISEKAADQGISVHTIYCAANESARYMEGWKKIAEKGQGKYKMIRLNELNIRFAKGYDNDMIVEANAMLNNTYIYYGERGQERYEKFMAIDNNTTTSKPPNLEIRLLTKISRLFQGKNFTWDLVDLDNRIDDANGDEVETRFLVKMSKLFQGKNLAWDLVDLGDKKKLNVSSLNKEFLPPELREYSDEELARYIEMKREERKQIIEISQMLSIKTKEYLQRREEFLEEYKANDNLSGVIIKTIRQEAPRYGYYSFKQ